MTILSLEKDTLRSSLKALRSSLSPERRESARQALFTSLLPFVSSFSAILSFNSFSTEIDLSLLNIYLASQGKLLLPKVDGDTLTIYRVTDLEQQLLPSPWGIKEPNPALCQIVPLANIPCVLVPALGFDERQHRLGYGKGHYDRLLPQLKHALTMGVGFKEQLVEEALPANENDFSLDLIRLF